MGKRLVIMALVLLTALFCSTSVYCGNTYKFAGLTIDQLGEANRLDMLKAIDGLLADFEEKTGIGVEYVEHKEPFAEQFRDENLDMALIGMEDYYRLKHAGIDLEPVSFLSLNGSAEITMCIYSRENVKSLEELRGTNFNLYGPGEYYAMYLATRKVMQLQGVDESVTDFFGKIYKIPYYGSAFQAMMLGTIDSLIESDWSMKYFSKDLPDLENVNEVACVGGNPAFGLFARPGIDRDDFKKIQKFASKIKSNPNLMQLRTVMLAFNASFDPPDSVLINNFDNLFEEAIEKGWDKEAEEFVSKMRKLEFGEALEPVKKKMSYSECKAECAEEADRESCMDRCMGE